MLIPGLVSVTFRKLSRADIAELMHRAELPAIEWGGDVHVPTVETADEFTVENALTEAAYYSADGKFYIASYGSYYRCDSYSPYSGETAVSVSAPNIRVWAGQRGSADADTEYRKTVARYIQLLCDEMAPHGITVSTEFHGGTLTDNYDSALRLISEVERGNFCTYWQPNQFRDEEYNTAALKAVLPYLSNVHVFTWDSSHRYPLADGEAKWRKYIDIIRSYGGSHHMLLEFVKDDSIEQFLRDAETLKGWLE
ncbi:MAG: sugar phosphate isomerase/epimerase family protein [Eubacteriales bacterium]